MVAIEAPDRPPCVESCGARHLTCEDAALVATTINTVWKANSDFPDDGIDEAFAGLIGLFAARLPRCWDPRLFKLVCIEGLEDIEL
jgi:hypothetical protein